MILSGWSYALADLLPWSHHQLLIISALMAIFDILLLALLYRDFRLWMIQVITLAFGIGAMIASMKLLHINLNLLNVLSFRLVLAIGVDYGIYVVLIWQKAREIEHDVAGVLKPVLLAGLTAVSGFGSLALARNPALTSLGIALCHWDSLELDRYDLLCSPGNRGHSAKNLTRESRGPLCPAKTFRLAKRLLNCELNARERVTVV